MKSIYKRILIIAIPVAFENMIFSLINFVDIFMIGKIGTAAISALGIANQIFFIFSCSVFGLLSGANVLSAQYYGIKDYFSLRKIMSLTIILGLFMSLPFMFMILQDPEGIIRFYTKDAQVINYSIQYLKISIYTFPLFSIAFSFAMQLRAINKPKYSLYSSIAALFINVFLNLILIPRYGVAGAATATLIARFSTTIYLYLILLYRKIPIIPRFKEIKYIDLNFIKKLLSISALTFIHEVLWVFADTIKVMLLGRMGTQAFSAIQIVVGINGLLFTLFIGLTNASAIIIGNEIGKSDKIVVYNYSKDCLKLFTYVMVVVIILLNLIAPFAINLMKLENELTMITKRLILSQSVVTVLYSYSMFYLSGMLRAGGDVMFSMLVEILLVWLVGLPLTYLAVDILNFSVYWVYIFARIDDLFKLYPCLKRYFSKKWIRKAI